MLALIAMLSMLYFLAVRERAQGLPLGPPSGYLGNGRFDMPDEPYRRFAELAKSYGPIFSFRLGHTPVIGALGAASFTLSYTFAETQVIVVNSAKVAWDLLEKRGEIYSSRPRNIMGCVLLS